MTTTEAVRPRRAASATSDCRLVGESGGAVLVEDARLAARLVDDGDAAPGLAGDGTSAWRMPLRARSAASPSPVAPPAVARASTSWPSAASTRATLMPLPPAREAPAATRWVSPGASRSTCQVRSRAGFGVTVTITMRPPRGEGGGEVARRERRAEQAGVVAELGAHECRAPVEAEQRVEPLGERVEQRRARLGEAAADDDRLGREVRDELGRGPATSASTASFQTASGDRVADARRVEHVPWRRSPGCPTPRGSDGRSPRPRRWSRGSRSRRRRTARRAGRRASGRTRPA